MQELVRQLDARNRNTPQAHEEARIARAEADYDIRMQRCDDLAGQRKRMCQQGASAVRDKARADAKAELQTEIAAGKANEKIAEARASAAEAKRDADYRVAIERCDTFAGERKDLCVRDAKARFGK